MSRKTWIGFLGLAALVVVGCSSKSQSTTVGESTPQSAIDAYKAEQAKDQASMDASLGTPGAPGTADPADAAAPKE